MLPAHKSDLLSSQHSSLAELFDLVIAQFSVQNTSPVRANQAVVVMSICRSSVNVLSIGAMNTTNLRGRLNIKRQTKRKQRLQDAI